MAKIKASSEITNILDRVSIDDLLPKLKDFARFVQLFMQDALQQINGNIDVIDNLRVKVKTVVFESADVNFSVAHGLSRAPVGYIVVGRSVDLGVYDGTGLTDSVNISLRSSAAGTAKILFY